LGPPITRVPCSADELAAADITVLCVDHPELPYDDIVDHARLILDTRGRLRGLGFRGESL
jgi:UDP-N-acetyl-D-mannosaminuronate dehydrogenase